ncbi:MAG: hypothetical protein F6K41_00645, partial [Symploca sp. SIO3E6]|nr:hypothetical protein [Caldora sp. SIO3E6]
MDFHKGRGQRAEGRRQKAEGRRQKAEGRRQKAEGRRQGRRLGSKERNKMSKVEGNYFCLSEFYIFL